MKKLVCLTALALTIALGSAAHAANYVDISGYANDPYAAQTAYDTTNMSVRKRMEAVRFGALGSGFAVAPILRSDDAFAMAPSSRYSSVAGTSRRQLDCVYYTGFTVWGDIATSWTSQKSRGGSSGYKYRGIAPIIGLDWSSGAFTVGLATSYNWGKLKSKSYDHDQKVRSWVLDAYVQYDSELWYANATLGYGYNRYRGDRFDDNQNITGVGPTNHDARYHSNSWNIDAEFGMKFNFGGFLVTPHAGIRYFHDRRGSFTEGGSPWGNYNVSLGRKNYNVLEVPLGVNVGYAINAGGALIVPQLRFAWIPELGRRRGNASGAYTLDDGSRYVFSENSPRRGRNAFQLGAGVEAKITRSISAHVDYNVIMRSKAYTHHLNLGLGFTF